MSDEYTERTLDSGETVRVYPPSEEFPEGREVLVKTGALRDRLVARRTKNLTAQEALLQAQRDRLAQAKQAQAEGTPIPFEKRFF